MKNTEEVGDAKVVVINRWLGHKVGGVENHVIQILERLDELGVATALITSGSQYLHRIPQSITVYSCDHKENGRLLFNLISFLFFI